MIVVAAPLAGGGPETVKTDNEGTKKQYELNDLHTKAAAHQLNALMAEGKSQDEAAAEFELTKPDLLKLNVFFVKDKYIARAWGGYTSTKATGNEGAGELGLGGSFKDIKPVS